MKEKMIEEMISVIIDGKTCQAAKGEYILDAARKNGIAIPTLCHHPALAGQGCCRVCVVEVSEGGAPPKVVVSCVYPITGNCEIFTASEKIVRIRRMIMAMLNARAPLGEWQAALGETCGAADYALKERPGEKCILCGLCARACEELGTGAIATVNRGIAKKIATPYGEPSDDCIGCLSCAAVCPAGAIDCAEKNGKRTIWGKTFDLAACRRCGKPFATREQLEWIEKSQTIDFDLWLCPDCRRKAAVSNLKICTNY